MSKDPSAPELPEILDVPVEAPQHVVYRTFVSETVMLNLETGTYHGLNPTAGRLLRALEDTSTPREAAGELARAYERQPQEVEEDVRAFCRDLLERKLIRRGGR